MAHYWDTRSNPIHIDLFVNSNFAKSKQDQNYFDIFFLFTFLFFKKLVIILCFFQPNIRLLLWKKTGFETITSTLKNILNSPAIIKEDIFHLLNRSHFITSLLSQHHLMTSSHILKLFMALVMPMHKCEIWKENSSFDCRFPGLFCNFSFTPNYEFMLYLCNIGIKYLFWEPHRQFLSFAFTDS